MLRLLRAIVHFPKDMWLLFVTYYPGRHGNALRYQYWRRKLKFCGSNVRIDVGVYIQGAKFISLDDHCWLDRNVVLMAGPPDAKRTTFRKDNPEFNLAPGEVYLSKNVHIAHNCVLSGIGGLFIGNNSGVASNSAIYSFSHHYRNPGDKEDTSQYSFAPHARLDQQSMILSPVVIGDYCAVGLNNTILPGTTLKRGSWLASGSVVYRTYEEQSLIAPTQNIEVKSLAHLKIKE